MTNAGCCVVEAWASRAAPTPLDAQSLLHDQQPPQPTRRSPRRMNLHFVGMFTMVHHVQLTRFSDLGLRVLLYLSQQELVEPVTSGEIATQFHVPHNHISKVVHKLGQLGWVETQRGRHGGLRLSAAAPLLTLGTIVRTLEGATSLVDCDDPPCVLRHGCSLKGVLDDALEAFYQALDRHTLADLYKQRTRSTLIALHRSHATARS